MAGWGEKGDLTYSSSKSKRSQNKVWFSLAAQPPMVSFICPMFNKQPCPPANIHINADSQLKWLQIKAESVIIERVLSWMTIKSHLIRGPAKTQLYNHNFHAQCNGYYG